MSDDKAVTAASGGEVAPRPRSTAPSAPTLPTEPAGSITGFAKGFGLTFPIGLDSESAVAGT
jgi:hypothetical protein